MDSEYAIDVSMSDNAVPLGGIFESTESKRRKEGINNDIATLQQRLDALQKQTDALQKQIDHHDKTCVVALLKTVEDNAVYIAKMESILKSQTMKS